ncbi:MAG: DarT ssDNA thymidine ADP-ribosyltransferase family protein [Leadbetterella sp.]|nr:DarT ssDNA thymidine ADP-ribosyltransferase family protein [Leadbetterella sp.]
MRIFDWIVGYFDKVRSRFRKKKQEQKVRERIVKTKGKSREEIQSTIEEKVKQEEALTAVEISELAETQTGIELQGLFAPPIKIRKRIFDLVEIEQEVTALNKKLIEVQIKQKQIVPVRFPQNYTTDKDIEELEQILQKHDNKQNLVLSTSAIDNLKRRFGQFDKFVQERILVGIYRIREVERAKEFKKFKHEIEALYVQVNKQIDQDDFQSAKLTIRKLEVLLKSIQALSVKIIQGKAKENNRVVSNLISRTVELKQKLSFRETEIEAKRQAEELKKQQEEAARRRLAEEARRREERKRREKAEDIQRQQEEAKRKKEEGKKQELQRLLAKKSNWQDYAQVLEANGITTLYHFTDRVNIASIKQNKGLYSWRYCDLNNILIIKSGGDSLSRGLDTKYNLQDFVRLSFCDDHPMQYRLYQSGYDLVLLKIDIGVAYLEKTRYSDVNATDSKHNQGSSIEDLKRVRFSATKKNYLRKDDPDFKFHQAEVLVKTWIPIEYITNINQF